MKHVALMVSLVCVCLAGFCAVASQADLLSGDAFTERQAAADAFTRGDWNSHVQHTMRATSLEAQADAARFEESLQEPVEPTEAERREMKIRDEWDRLLKKCGVTRWKYNAEKLSKTTRLTATLVLGSGRTLTFRRKYMNYENVPSPVDLLVEACPGKKEALAVNINNNAPAQQVDQARLQLMQSLLPTPYDGGINRPGYCKYCGVRVLGKRRSCTRCEWQLPQKYLDWQQREKVKAQQLQRLLKQ